MFGKFFKLLTHIAWTTVFKSLKIRVSTPALATKSFAVSLSYFQGNFTTNANYNAVKRKFVEIQKKDTLSYLQDIIKL